MTGLTLQVHEDTDTGFPSTARFSDCMRYRYSLTRRWATDGPTAVFLMLNPSTADAFKLDPTITRCRGFAKREGCAGLTVLNLFAWRSTDPKALAVAPDAVGEHNDRMYDCVLRSQDDLLVIAGWGAHPFAAARAAEVTERVRRMHPLLCLGTTKAGHPRHPLYVKGDAPLVTYADSRPVLA